MPATLLLVKNPDETNNTPAYMASVRSTINSYCANFNIPESDDGLPTQREDGTFEIHVADNEITMSCVKQALSGRKMEIVDSEPIAA